MTRLIAALLIGSAVIAAPTIASATAVPGSTHATVSNGQIVVDRHGNRYTFRKDGTFTTVRRDRYGVVHVIRGTWHVENEQLCMKYNHPAFISPACSDILRQRRAVVIAVDQPQPQNIPNGPNPAPPNNAVDPTLDPAHERGGGNGGGNGGTR
jgi:hypothetical protein